MKKIEQNKIMCSKWFQSLRNLICKEIEALEEGSVKFKRKKWFRNPNGSENMGGGEMSVLRGDTFEKAGVNISTVFGSISTNLKGKIPGTDNYNKFWASGISVVIHPFSPKIPAVHMNTRHIITKKSWFGGGMDITPTDLKSKESEKLAEYFHDNLKKICEENKKGSYKEYKKWCDEYFFLPHRKETRGIGGIFFDYKKKNFEEDFSFVRDVGLSFKKIFYEMIKKKNNLSWSSKHKEIQYVKRGRYVEFNLLYDRGTIFGLKTNGNVDAILMSLPPLVKWK